MEKKNIDWGNLGFGYVKNRLQICLRVQERLLG